MLSLPLVGRALLSGLGLVCLVSLASAAVPVPTAETPTDLVRKLGADSFDVREEASRQLARLGRQVLPALFEGSKSPDREIVRRCLDLIERANRTDLEAALDAFLENRDEKHLLKLPAWPKFQKTVGNSPGARNLFVQMCTADGVLLAALDRQNDPTGKSSNPVNASKLYNQRCQDIQQRMFQPFGLQQGLFEPGELAALLYVGMHSSIQVEPNLRYIVNNILHQQGPQQWLRSDETARKLLAAYIENRSDVNLVHNHLYLVQNLNIRECLDWVARMAENKSQQPYVRATALATLGKLGGREVLPKLEAFFNDTTQLTRFQQAQNVMIQTEVRDVALAMAVLASGQDLVSYNYPWLVQMATHLAQNPQMPYHSAFQLGFANSNQRDAAFKRYAAWKGRQPEMKK